MRFSSAVAALAATIPFTNALYQGFNVAANNEDGSCKTTAQWATAFNKLKALPQKFVNVRLYASSDCNTLEYAVPAAIQTGTKILVGVWAEDATHFSAEKDALNTAIKTHGSSWILAVSVGSEDLYRGDTTASTLAGQIYDVRGMIRQYGANQPVGHVDTWTAWVNGSNDAVISAVDWIGMDVYPYFQTTFANGIDNGDSLFSSAYDQTVAAANGKLVWVTETGWPVSGSTANQAVPSTANARTYWDQVGCNRLFGKVNTWWYTLQDSVPSTPDPSFGIVGSTLSTQPLFDLSCSAASSVSPSAAPAPSSSVAAASAQAGGKAGAQGEVSAFSAASASLPKTSATGNVVSGQSAASRVAGNGGDSTVYTTVTTCPATSVSGTVTSTYLTTSTVVITSCSGGCPTSTLEGFASQSGAAQPPNTLITKTSALASASTGACPASLSGTYEYPHLIVPVDKSQPSKASGTSYNGTISSTISSIFNFDIPASDAGKTCSLVFLLPTQDKLTTSAFSLSGSGGFDVALLSGPATEQTTYNTVPSVSKDLGGPSSVTPGNEYVIASGTCPSGQRIGYEVTATGSLALDYFQDYNPSPIGFYITVC